MTRPLHNGDHFLIDSPMSSTAPVHTITPARPARGLALLLGWRRIRATLIVATALTLLQSMVWQSSFFSLAVRVFGVALLLMIVFGVFEQWPARLPKWLARWVLQVVAVAVTVPISLFIIYVLSTEPGAPPFWREELRVYGFGMLTMIGLLFAPWVALAALVRQREAFAREQALAFDLERSELARQALDARMRLLQAQVQPHFLFNTLANVRALVNTGSPQAPRVLDSLIAYLRAAVPRLNEPASTLGQELDLVRAYLELMHMRIPDRLLYAIRADDAVRPLRCPPMSLLTLVENAVRHGIDPSEQGGRIDIDIELRDGRCRVCVCDTGVGLRRAGDSLGTGLSSLRERLQLVFAGDAHLRLTERTPHGVVAELDWPTQIP